MKYIFSILIFMLLLMGCAAHTQIEPVGKGKLSTNASMGGPIVKAFGTRVPVPYATAGVDYGLDNRLDIKADLHLLSLPYRIFGLELGPIWYPCLNNGKIPTIGVQPRLMTLISLKSDVEERMKVYPILSGSAAWKLHKGLVYIGTDVTVPFSSSDYDEDAASTIISPFMGYRWHIGKQTYLYTEIKWQGANIRSDQLAVEYLPIGNNGAITTLFAIQRSF